jgi:regulatory protein
MRIRIVNDVCLQDVKNKAIDYLSRRDHSEAELRSKLAKKGFDEVLVEQAILAMFEANYLNEERYARMIIRAGFERGHGPQKIQFKMKQQGLTQDQIHATFEEFEADWFEKARALRARKFGVIASADSFKDKAEYFKERSRQMRFLAGRGFGMAHIEYALERSSEDDEY